MLFLIHTFCQSCQRHASSVESRRFVERDAARQIRVHRRKLRKSKVRFSGGRRKRSCKEPLVPALHKAAPGHDEIAAEVLVKGAHVLHGSGRAQRHAHGETAHVALDARGMNDSGRKEEQIAGVHHKVKERMALQLDGLQHDNIPNPKLVARIRLQKETKIDGGSQTPVFGAAKLRGHDPLTLRIRVRLQAAVLGSHEKLEPALHRLVVQLGLGDKGRQSEKRKEGGYHRFEAENAAYRSWFSMKSDAERFSCENIKGVNHDTTVGLSGSSTSVLFRMGAANPFSNICPSCREDLLKFKSTS